jgi:hypothetical protein
METCEDCAGTGTEWVRTGGLERPWEGKDVDCATCGGTGVR